MQIKDNEKWETLGINNDFIFSKLMRDKEVCKQVLEILLNFKIFNIKYIEDEKANNLIRKGVKNSIFYISRSKYPNYVKMLENTYMHKQNRVD